MDVLQMLVDYKIINISIILGIVGLMNQMRKAFLNDLLTTVIKVKALQFLILSGSALLISFLITSLTLIYNFNVLEWVKSSTFNWIFSYIFYDTVKNIFFKES